jgi:hypothetical protein
MWDGTCLEKIRFRGRKDVAGWLANLTLFRNEIKSRNYDARETTSFARLLKGGHLKIDLKWDKPIRLKRASRQKNEIYSIRSLDRIPKKAGVYIFARTFGKFIQPLYVGQGLKLRGRIKGQLNNAGLMMGIKNAQAGRRILLVGHLKPHPGQQKGKVLDIVESALIKHALAAGCDLLNKQGVKTRVHVIRSKGNTASKQVAPFRMLVERK